MSRTQRSRGSDRRSRRTGLGPAAIAPVRSSSDTSSPVSSLERTAKLAESTSAPEPEALVVTHRFDSGDGKEPYTAVIRLTGRRQGVQGPRSSGDAFVHEERVNRVVPGSGAVSVTSWIYSLNPGDWSVEGQLLRLPPQASDHKLGHHPSRPEALEPAHWSWRHWSLGSEPRTTVQTRWALTAPLARIPAVIPGSYPLLFAVGVVVALVMQLAILGSEQIALPRSIFASLLALVAGLLGAKVWYRALHPNESLLHGGWAVDGFLVTAPLVAIVALVVFDLPIGAYLDASAPGLFLAVAIGRVGCFLTGCCAGHMTASRWGVWSSDRRVGARRVPTQLMESAAGLLIGLASVPLVLLHMRAIHGAVFVAALLAYFVVRQSLLRLRAESRRFLWRRALAPKPA